MLMAVRSPAPALSPARSANHPARTSMRRSAPDMTLANTGAATVPPWANVPTSCKSRLGSSITTTVASLRVRRRHQAGKYRHDSVGGIAAGDRFKGGARFSGHPIADERSARRRAALFDHLLHQLHKLMRDLGIQHLLAGDGAGDALKGDRAA